MAKVLTNYMLSNYVDKKVLVTGGLGFIGSNLAIQLLELGAKVTVIDSLIPESGGNKFNVASIEPEIEINYGDLRDAEMLGKAVVGMDYIFHLAGQVSHGDSMRDPELDLGMNCISSLNLVEACRHNCPQTRIVYTSTRQVYGVPQELPVTEAHPTLPVDVNGINKLAAEYYHLLYDRTYGLKSTVLRLTNTYGPRQQIRNNRQGFAGIFIRKALLGEPIEIFGDGEQRRDFNYVDDAVEALLLAGCNDACFGKVFNLGAESNYSLNEFIEALQKFKEFKTSRISFPDDKKLIDIGDYYGNFSALKLATGWNPKVDLNQGLGRTLEFYHQHHEIYLS